MGSSKNQLNLDLGQEHITIQRRYEALGAVNDFLIAVWFLIGSFFFLNESLVESGTWLFIAGSAQLIIIFSDFILGLFLTPASEKVNRVVQFLIINHKYFSFIILND